MAILSTIINFIHPVGADPVYKTKSEILNQVFIILSGFLGVLAIIAMIVMILKYNNT